MSPPAGPPRAQPPAVDLRIDRLLVETAHEVDAFALQLALADAVRDVIADRGLPEEWLGGVHRPAVTVDGFVWDGRGAEPGLARALAEFLFDGGLSSGVAP